VSRQCFAHPFEV